MAPRKHPTGDDDALDTNSTGFRMSASMLARLDAYAAEMMKATPGLKFTRSDAVRVLILKALDDHEGKMSPR